MLVILVKSVRKLGKVGEVVDVKTGFGRNYLIPQKIAVRATEENMKLIESKRQEYEEKDLQMRKEAESFNGSINGTEITFVKQASSDGKLFGSVTNKDISKELNDKFGYKVEHGNILLSSPIKSLGVYPVEILLHAEINAQILVSIARSEIEAVAGLRNFTDKTDDQSSADENSEENNITFS